MLEAFLAACIVLLVVVHARYKTARAPRVMKTAIRRKGRDRGVTIHRIRPGLTPSLALLLAVLAIRLDGIRRDGVGSSSHAALTGLDADDHTQYAKGDGTRGNFARVVNVKHSLYGAVGDGVTDDTAALQAAIDALDGGYGGTVYYPQGRYRTTAPLNISQSAVDNHVNFLGEGYQASIIEVGHAGVGLKVGSATYAVDSFSMRHMSVNERAGSTSTNGVELRNAGQVHFDHVRISGHGGVCLSIQDSIGCSFRHLFVDNAGSHGIKVLGTSTNNLFMAGRLTANAEYGLYVTGADAQHNTFIGLDFEANTKNGVYIDATSSWPAKFRDCWVESNGNAGNINGQFEIAGACRGVTIDECTFAAGEGYDVYVASARETLIRNCYISPTVGDGGIKITSTASNTIIEDFLKGGNGHGPVNLVDESSTTVIIGDLASGTADGLMREIHPTLLDGTLATPYGGGAGARTNAYPYGKFDTVNKVDAGDNPPTTTKDVAEGFLATPALKIAFPTGNNAYCKLSDAFSVTTGQNVWVSFKAKASRASNYEIDVRVNEGESGATAGTKRLRLTTSWRYFAFLIPSTFTSADARIQFANSYGAMGSTMNVWIDELQVEVNVASPSPFIPTNGAARTSPGGFSALAVTAREVYSDTINERTSASGVTVDGVRLKDGTLGVANSAAATVLGSVVKKVQIFDASGNSLGYVPVYDAIT